MKKMFLMSALALSGAISANASSSLFDAFGVNPESPSNGYEYTLDQSTKLDLSKGTGSGNSAANWAQSNGYGRYEANLVHCDGLTVDFSQDARYEITFAANFFVNSTIALPVCNLTMVNSGGDVSFLFGNSNDDPCQAGLLLYKNAGNVSTGLYSLNSPADFLSAQVWTLGANQGVRTGLYKYKIVFETFADPNLQDQIDFRLYLPGENDSNGQYSTFVNLDTSHLNCGAATDQVFTDIGFTLIGADYPSGSNTPASNENGVTLLSMWDGEEVGTFKKYTRTKPEEPEVPEPSAFGLLAGLGAIALAVSRRRRSR